MRAKSQARGVGLRACGVRLMPGWLAHVLRQGGVLAAKILSDPVFVDEIKEAKTREDCMLVVWKCKAPFPCVLCWMRGGCARLE